MTETSAPPVSIAEFLTARLDEKEAAANSRTRMATGPAETCVVGGVELTAAWSDLESDPDRRALADIAAKRRMVERAWLSVQYLPPEMRTPAKDAAAYDAFWVLAELASVYSDHSDYREEWKP